MRSQRSGDLDADAVVAIGNAHRVRVPIGTLTSPALGREVELRSDCYVRSVGAGDASRCASIKGSAAAGELSAEVVTSNRNALPPGVSRLTGGLSAHSDQVGN